MVCTFVIIIASLGKYLHKLCPSSVIETLLTENDDFVL